MKKRSLIPIAKNPKGVTLKSERQTLQIAFLFPLFLSLLILVLVPMASLLGLSFTNYKMTGGKFRFIGLENYIDLFTALSMPPKIRYLWFSLACCYRWWLEWLRRWPFSV